MSISRSASSRPIGSGLLAPSFSACSTMRRLSLPVSTSVTVRADNRVVVQGAPLIAQIR